MGRKGVTTGPKLVSNLLPEFDWKSLNESNKQVLANVASSDDHVMETDQSAVRVEMPQDNDDCMDVEQEDANDLGTMEVNIPQKKAVKQEAKKKSTSFKVNMADPSCGVQLTGTNVTANQNLKNALKMKKKKQKRADEIGNSLGNAFESAFSGFEAQSEKTYDFDTNMED